MMVMKMFLSVRYVLKGSSSSGPDVAIDGVKTTVSQPLPPEPSAPVPMKTPAPPTKVAAPPTKVAAPLNHHPVKQEEEEPSTSQEQAVRPKARASGEPKDEMTKEDDERPGTSQQGQGPAPSATPTNFVPFAGSGQRLGGPGPAGLKSSTSWSSCVSGSPPKAKKPKPSNEIKV